MVIRVGFPFCHQRAETLDCILLEDAIRALPIAGHVADALDFAVLAPGLSAPYHEASAVALTDKIAPGFSFIDAAQTCAVRRKRSFSAECAHALRTSIAGTLA